MAGYSSLDCGLFAGSGLWGSPDNPASCRGVWKYDLLGRTAFQLRPIPEMERGCRGTVVSFVCRYDRLGDNRRTLAVGVWCFCIVASVFVFYGLANHSLIQEGREVIDILKKQGVEAGRRRLSWIVGRDTSELSPKGIYTAVLETMAENLSDGVVAPLFYYALGGFPAMMAYKMVNTLDSMIGYKDERYRQFGCMAARLDDVLNYIPARLTALFMALVAYRPGLFRFIFRYCHQHASPNSGFPESAMAGNFRLPVRRCTRLSRFVGREALYRG